MYRLTEKERIEWFVLECKMKLIERVSWRDYPLFYFMDLNIHTCFPDYIDENGNFYEISCFEPQHLVGHLDVLEPIYDEINKTLWNDGILQQLHRENKQLLEEECYDLAETL